MQKFKVTIELTMVAEDRTNARYLLTNAICDMPIGAGPVIDDIKLEEVE